jgi:hypothetical protein
MSESERDQPEDVSVPIDLYVPDDLQSHYVHNVIVQPGQREFALFFFETQVPPFVGSPKENKDELMRQGVRFKCVGKMIVAPELVPEMIQALQVGLSSYNDANRDQKGEANT